jgi:NADH dehydrogenase
MSARIVIAGGGFGGFYAARALERIDALRGARVTLVNETNYLLYTPLLPGAAGATLDPRHVLVPLREQLRHTDLLIGSVTGLGAERRELAVRRIDGEGVTLGYDHLLIALGSVSRALPVPGLVAHAIGLKTLGDATALRNKLLGCLDIAESLEDPAERSEYLGFVFVGAGYAGLEGLAELQDFAARAIELYPRCRAHGMRWLLVEARERIAPEVPPACRPSRRDSSPSAASRSRPARPCAPSTSTAPPSPTASAFGRARSSGPPESVPPRRWPRSGCRSARAGGS